MDNPLFNEVGCFFNYYPWVAFVLFEISIFQRKFRLRQAKSNYQSIIVRFGLINNQLPFMASPKSYSFLQ